MKSNASDMKLLDILKSIDDSEEGKDARQRLFEELQKQSPRHHLMHKRVQSAGFVKTRVRAGIAG